MSQNVEPLSVPWWGLGSAAVVGALMLLGGCGDAPEAEKPEPPVVAEPEPEWPPPPTPVLVEGHAVFGQTCHNCHIESEYAPEISDEKEWARRLKKAEGDITVLYDHAINGFGDMLPKGGKKGKHLTEDQVKAGVDYMVAITIGEVEPPAP